MSSAQLATEHADTPQVQELARMILRDLKESAGNLTGDEKMKREGQSDQAEGKLQNAWGSQGQGAGDH